MTDHMLLSNRGATDGSDWEGVFHELCQCGLVLERGEGELTIRDGRGFLIVTLYSDAIGALYKWIGEIPITNERGRQHRAPMAPLGGGT